MKKVFLLSLLLVTTLMTFSQDVIIKTSGDKIKCKITDTDSTNIYFAVTRDGNEINTFINKSLVKEVHYGVSTDDPYVSVDMIPAEHNSISVGILMGGGSLIGADFETLVVNRLGLQIGAGYIGFGGSINIHFKPAIRSSFLSLQYWHQGVGASYTQSMLGPSFVFRGKKWFTAQLGFGFTLDTGPAFPEDMEPIPVMLTYAIGAYFPW